jgi:N-methylhydantoinase A
MEQMIQEGVPGKDVRLLRSLDLRYLGQGYELEISAPDKNYEKKDLESLCYEFSRVHREKYGYTMAEDTVEIVNLRLTAIGGLSKPMIREESPSGKDLKEALKGTRRVYMDGEFMEASIYERKKLKCGNEIQAPAIIEQLDSTTVLFPGYKAFVDKYRNLVIELKKEN